MTIELYMSLKLSSTKFRLYFLKVIFGDVLVVNRRCYGRCHVKSTYTNVFFPQISESFNVFDKCSRVLSFVFSRN